MWRSLDACAGEDVSRTNADYTSYASERAEQRDVTGPRRVCWNSWAAPHNFEGVFLHNGDVLVKDGQPELARAMYRNARLSRDYDSWPHRAALEQRIATAEQRSALFAAGGDGTMMVNSPLACTGCHQR
jgi:hypothetical protein